MSAGQQTEAVGVCGVGQQRSTCEQPDDTCNIKVEPCETTKKFFTDFEELFALAKEVQEINISKIEALMKRVCILRNQNNRLREKNCTLRAQYKRLLKEYNILATEVHDDSCSSESEDELKGECDDKDVCTLM